MMTVATPLGRLVFDEQPLTVTSIQLHDGRLWVHAEGPHPGKRIPVEADWSLFAPDGTFVASIQTGKGQTVRNHTGYCHVELPVHLDVVGRMT